MKRVILFAAIAFTAASPSLAASFNRVQFYISRAGALSGDLPFEDTFVVALAPAIAPEDENGLQLHVRKACGRGECYTTRDVTYFTDSAGGGLVIEDATGLRFSGVGDQLFTGSTSRPIFRLGTFDFSSDRLGNPIIASLTVTGVPEPAGWAMLIAGFGLTGAALRRRRIASA